MMTIMNCKAQHLVQIGQYICSHINQKREDKTNVSKILTEEPVL